MIQTFKNAMVMAVTGITFVMAGCGGGNGGSGVPSVTTKVAGTASKGIFTSGTVTVFKADSSGVKSTLLNSGTISPADNGKFNIDIGAYTGPIVVEVSGTYTDEATNKPVTVDASSPLHAVVSNVTTSSPRIAVTPLTDLAYGLVAATGSIDAANARVSSIFKIYDITTVEPVPPVVAALGTASTDQQAYTLALATLSQMALNNSAGAPPSFAQISALTTSFAADLAASPTGGLSSPNITAFSTALGTVAAPAGPLSGFTTAVTALGSVGAPTIKLTLSTAGSLPAGTLIGGISGTITFPSGASMRVDPTANGQLLKGLMTTTGSASSSLADARFASSALTFAIINGNGFSIGDFATILADISSGSPTAADFLLTKVRVIDTGGAEISGVSVTLH